MELQPAGPSLRVDRLKPVSKARFSPECGGGCWEVGGPAEEFGSWDGWGLKIWASVGVHGGSQRASPWHRLSAQVVCVCVCEWVTQLCPILCDPMDCNPPAEEGYSLWDSPDKKTGSGLPFPSSGDLPNPGIEPGFSTSLADSLLTEPPGKPTSTGHRLLWTHRSHMNPLQKVCR